MRMRRASSDVQAVLSKGEVMQLAPYIAGTLNLEAASVGNALAKALAALADKQANPRPEPMLKLSHQCRNVGCHVPGCGMCQCNPNKKCLRQLDVKYLAFEAIKSGCGAELTVQLVNRDGTLAAPEAAAGMYVQMKLLNARAGQATKATSEDGSAAAAQLQACVLSVNKEGKPLLFSTDGKGSSDYWVTVPMTESQIPLPRLSITESSEALMAGQKPPMQLWMQAVDAQGKAINGIPPFLSDEFVVTTIRSSSRKPEIPLVSDSVSKLQSIGKETVAKLKDIHAAALASPNPGDASTLQDFTQHTNSVTTVEQFCKLIAWCELNEYRPKCVQRVLKVTRGWAAAATHAKAAVPEDTRPRVFDSGSGMLLLYACKHGKVDMRRAAGYSVLTRQADCGFAFAPITAMTQEEVQKLGFLEKQAQQQWQQTGHPGWSLLPNHEHVPRGQMPSPQRSFSGQESVPGRASAETLSGSKRSAPCGTDSCETVGTGEASALDLESAFQGLPDALSLPEEQADVLDALPLDPAFSSFTGSTSGLDVSAATALTSSPGSIPARRLLSSGYNTAQMVPNLPSAFAERPRPASAELPDHRSLTDSRPPKRQALAPSSCNLMPDLWPTCGLHQSHSLPVDSRLTSSPDTSSSVNRLSFSLESPGRCDEAAPETYGTAGGLRKYCESFSRSITPMFQMQQCVPNHMGGLMPSSFSWGAPADPMWTRQALGFSTSELDQEIDSFMAGGPIPMHL